MNVLIQFVISELAASNLVIIVLMLIFLSFDNEIKSIVELYSRINETELIDQNIMFKKSLKTIEIIFGNIMIKANFSTH